MEKRAWNRPGSEDMHGLQSRGSIPFWRKLFLCLLLALGSPAFAGPLIIDDFAYTNNASARAAWTTSYGPAVTVASSGEWGSEQAMILACDFATRNSRCYWDRSTAVLDLEHYADFELDVYTANPSPISHFTLYFRSGNGWYGCSVSLRQSGWQTLRFGRGDFIPEGTPAGWDKIDGIRLSPWKATSENTVLALAQLRAATPAVLLVRDTETSNPGVVQETIDRHISWLGNYGVRCGITTRAGVEAGNLQYCQMAILPYNEAVSETEMAQYESFVASGGKLMVYYLLPGRLAPLLGFRVVMWTPGNFTAWLFSDLKITNLPPRVLQASWNITIAEPTGNYNSRVTARWENNLGQNTGRAAWLSSDRGFFMSHVLLSDDPENKAYALMCLLGSVLPDAWPAAAAGAIKSIGQVGPYTSFEQAVSDIRRLAAPTLRAREVEEDLVAAESYRLSALEHQAAGRYAQAMSSANAAKTHLRNAYVHCLKPVYPEFRAIWEHHAEGPYPGDWARGIEVLASNQFNAVFPNMLWGGLAHYNSAYLPRSAEYNQYGDQIAACVAAAHAKGVEVHVWKVNWNLLNAPQSFIDSLRSSNRTQVSSSGEAIDWLCPSHPDNLALETNSMVEVVRNYDIDGIHFDYIRYPDSHGCYCSGCAARFQAQTGWIISNWPAGVLSSGPARTAFLKWRRAQITKLVETVYIQTKAVKPHVKVSAAVFPDAASAYDEVGQDWRLWVTNGILDFVCPMDYTTEFHGFTNRVARQLTDVAGRMPVYPGIGAFILETDGTLAQVEATRAMNTGGFILFELSPKSALNLLPEMGIGATANDEPDLDGDWLPDSWEVRWFGSTNSTARDSDADRDGVTEHSEYVLGSDPKTAVAGLQVRAVLKQGSVEVSFEARPVEGMGYRNAERRYRLESAACPGLESTWVSVPGYEDLRAGLAGGRVTLTIVPDGTGPQFYRVQAWLQQVR